MAYSPGCIPSFTSALRFNIVCILLACLMIVVSIFVSIHVIVVIIVVPYKKHQALQSARTSATIGTALAAASVGLTCGGHT
jgi:uncharacterized membrane protein